MKKSITADRPSFGLRSRRGYRLRGLHSPVVPSRPIVFQTEDILRLRLRRSMWPVWPVHLKSGRNRAPENRSKIRNSSCSMFLFLEATLQRRPRNSKFEFRAHRPAPKQAFYSRATKKLTETLFYYSFQQELIYHGLREFILKSKFKEKSNQFVK